MQSSSPVSYFCFLFLITDFDKPDFKRSIVCFEDLSVGTVLTGKVENATPFGVFVDIGVGKAGLIPVRNITESKLSKVKKRRSLGLGPGERVEVKVLNVDIPRLRITLDLIRVLWEGGFFFYDWVFILSVNRVLDIQTFENVESETVFPHFLNPFS